MSGEIANTELISRFILDKSQIRSSDKTVKHNAFLPQRNSQLSVYRTNGLSENEIWAIADQFVAQPRQKAVIARADLPAAAIVEAGLQLNPTDLPHPRHANVVGWAESSSENRLTAIKLAAKAHLIER